MWPLPASFPVEGGDLFLSFLSLPSLCMGVAAQSQQQCWIPAPWVKAGLPAEEMLWKWDLLLLWRGTGYFRSRLCWRYGLGQDYCSCLREVLLYQNFPVIKAIDITKRNSPVHQFISSLFSLASGLRHVVFPTTEIIDGVQQHKRPSPLFAPSQKNRISTQVPNYSRRKGLSGCQSEGSAKEHGNTKFQQSLARLTTLLRKIQSSAALKEVTLHCLPEIHWFPL